MLKKEQKGLRRKMLKNKIIAVLTVISLCMPVMAIDETMNTAEQQNSNAVMETVEQSSTSAEENIKDADSENVEQADDTTALTEEKSTTPYKQPTSKKKIMKKFLLAMLGVAGSSILLFAILSIYNRVVYGKEAARPELMRGESQLETPETINEAVKSFVDKTKWDN